VTLSAACERLREVEIPGLFRRAVAASVAEKAPARAEAPRGKGRATYRRGRGYDEEDSSGSESEPDRRYSGARRVSWGSSRAGKGPERRRGREARPSPPRSDRSTGGKKKATKRSAIRSASPSDLSGSDSSDDSDSGGSGPSREAKRPRGGSKGGAKAKFPGVPICFKHHFNNACKDKGCTFSHKEKDLKAYRKWKRDAGVPTERD
jgi:hypothetical protein